MKIVRLNHEQYRRWRSNHMALVNPAGDFVRYTTEAESDAAETARKRGTIVKVRDKGIELSFTTDRDVLKNELLKRYGSCRIQLFNGHFIGQVLDPNLSRLSAPAPSVETLVSPEHCLCAKWGGRQPGKHHPACRNNKLAPPEQRGYPKEQIIDAAPEAPAVLEQTSPENAASNEFVPSPEECTCREWAKPGDSDPNLHHPTCQFFDPWNLRESGDYGLCDMDGNYRRPAVTDEVRAAELSMEKNGTPIITINGEEYLVIKAEEEPVSDGLSSASA